MPLTKLLRPSYQVGLDLYGRMARGVYRAVTLPPLRVTVMVTNRCNLHCPFCTHRADLNQPDPDRLSVAEWRKIIDKSSRLTSLDFGGGEPFLAPGIMDILDYALSKNRWVWIVSNGTPLNRERIHFLVDRKVAFFRCSIDGMAAYHERIRGSDTAFERVADTLREIQEYKRRQGATFPITGIKMNLMPDNWDQVLELLKFAEHDLGVDQFYFNLMYENPVLGSFQHADDLDDPRFSAGNTYIYPKECFSQAEEAVRNIFHYRKTSRMTVGFSQEMNEEDVVGYIRNPSAYNVRTCSEPWTGFTLHWDGTIAPCVSYRIDNIRNLDYDLNRVLSHSRYRSFLSVYKKRMPFAASCGGCCKKHERVQ